jgi:3-oxoacyl-[acyl-carrier-protein] synthase II
LRRVVVTGLGCLTPVGSDARSTWDGLIAGRSGIDQITLFDSAAYDVHFAGEVKNFNPDVVVPKKDQRRMDRFILLALAATKMAMDDSGLEWTESLRATTGTIVGAGMGGLPLIEETHTTLMNKGPSRITPFFIPQVILNLAAGQISITHGFQGPNYSVTSACATGCHSIGEAAYYIQRGQCDVMVAGGAESTVCGLGVGGFAAMKALSTRNEAPQKASRPWDKDRDGFVLAEGAGILILEELEHAKKRGARIYGELVGYGVSSDAHHMTNPSPGGAGAKKAMQMALAQTAKAPGSTATELGYINAHGTSTPAGDVAESQAVEALLGDDAKKVWVSSTKSAMGHTLGAAGAIESIVSLMALHTGKIPPTLNLDNPSDDCRLDYVPHTARERKLDLVMNNSFGFGGTNASLVFRKV